MRDEAKPESGGGELHAGEARESGRRGITAPAVESTREPAGTVPPPRRLDRLTWTEAVESFRRDSRLIFPVGTCLQHGPHLPLGTDLVIVERLAADVAARLDVLLAPTLPFGVVSRRDRGYAGTGGLDRKTLHRVLNELAESWERQGLRELILMTAHGYGPHIQTLASVLTDTLRVRAIDIHAIDLSGFLSVGSAPEHAGELETSLLLWLAPELVDAAAIPEGETWGPERDGARGEPVPPAGSVGVVGRPAAADAEKGRRIHAHLVRHICDRLRRDEAAA